MSNYVDWQGLDRGHEKYWGRSVWTGVLMALNECGGSADFLNENSAIYTILDEKIPQAEWHSTEADGSWRSNFRDAREPWTGLGVISFDETQMKLTENGRQLLTGEKTFGEIICETARTYSENNENPFAILASVFLGLPINQGLSIDDVVKIMRHYRPDSNDDLQNVLLGGPEEISDTAKRRLRHILRLLTFTGGIVFDSNAYYVASKRVLESFLVKTSFSLEETKKSFVQWLEINCRGSESFKNDMVKIIESWLDRKMPGNAIGNLFRFSNSSEYETEKARIMALPNFETVNQANQNGRPKTALNHYENFLRSINSRGVVAESIQEQTTKGFVSPFTPSQIIYYGVPGCGKSYEVNKVINAELDKYGVTDKEYHKVRCVFHPEYCNADFVGQIYPYVKPDNGGVEYRFKPGPFAEIVRRAYRNPAEPFFLIIEEINRGNAAAIFGEMFQLLDRIRPEDGPEELSGNIYNTGWSSYGVTNIDVNAYVRQKSTDNPEKIEYDDCVPYGDEIKFINNTAVRLPPNLSIYATMNTNDQNVFTMDNAFQRRFKSKMIRNVLDENSAQYKTEIDDTGVCWGNFREWINEKILLPQTAVLKADDKCLGGWFITGEKVGDADKIKKEDFAEKVLKYLWDDVFKRNKSGEIFVKDDKVNSLSDLIDAFETAVGFESFEKIFNLNDVDKAKLKK